jgi:predicted membrane channel-forming protein YqfA (hemolysin III family)
MRETAPNPPVPAAAVDRCAGLSSAADLRWEHGMQGAGGTPGGLPQFLIGFALAVAGGWLLLNQVHVGGGSWSLWGYNSFGLSLLPFVIGTGMLFFDGSSKLGWLLMIAAVTIIIAGVLVNLQIYFQPTSLFNTLMMLGLLAGGIGLIARSLKAPSGKDLQSREPR